MQGYNTGNKINHTAIIKLYIFVFLLDLLTADNIKVMKIFFSVQTVIFSLIFIFSHFP